MPTHSNEHHNPQDDTTPVHVVGDVIDASHSTDEAPLDDHAVEYAQLQEGLDSGAGWFYWIAVLSLVNSVLFITGSEWGFYISLAVTSIVDGLAMGAIEEFNNPTIIKSIAFGFNLVITGICGFFGFMAKKKQLWAFYIGMTLLALDGAIMALFQEWISVAFHGYAIFCIFKGTQCAKAMKQIEISMPPIQRAA